MLAMYMVTNQVTPLHNILFRDWATVVLLLERDGNLWKYYIKIIGLYSFMEME